MTKIFVLGYPGDMGGANTECWHTVKLWRRFGVDVRFIPTWGIDPKWEKRLDDIGCTTHRVDLKEVENIPDLPGGITVGFCNSDYIRMVPRLRAAGCRIVWLNCMTFLFEHERKCFEAAGPPDAMIYQSSFQRSELEQVMPQYGYDKNSGHLIHGAFDINEWNFLPRPHEAGETFLVGRAARPDCDKWSCNTWKIYSRIPYSNKKALMLGTGKKTLEKLGPTPDWADCLKPMAIPVHQYYACLHCLFPINGGARENWPRAGLEAFASGVPVVAQNQWGWKEMIDHGNTGFLGNNDEELAYYAARLAYDEELRMHIVHNAYRKLMSDLANPEKIWLKWRDVFARLS